MTTPRTQRFARKTNLVAIVGILCAALIGFASPVLAQQTTASVRGTITGPSGEPVANAEVMISRPGTGRERSVVTDETGFYNIRNLTAGVPHTISVDAPGLAGAAAEEFTLGVGQTLVKNYMLTAVEEVKVTGQRVDRTEVAVGPTAVFDLTSLQDSPSVNRNINDIIQQDPRIYIDQSRGDVDSIQCNGANPRYNSLTVDGIRLNDGFGLNSNGYPTQRMPFPYDAISSVAVELAPMSVIYGGFSACNINAVTKTGTNEFFGSAFIDYGSDSLRGDSLEGEKINVQPFSETRYGFEIGGPIIKDKLFFYAAYEMYNGADLNERGALGTGAVNEVLVTQAELDEIAQISRDIYGFDPGSSVSKPFDFDDEKYLLKLDWYVSEKHRLSATYMYNDSFNATPSDEELNEFEFDLHFYKRGAELKSYSVNFYSDWNDRLSTEIRYSYTDVDFLQQSFAGTDFGEVRVELPDVDVYLGADDSRHANDLDWQMEQIVLRGSYLLGNHLITAGYEREDLDVFNLFYQHVDTEMRFDGIDAFRNGMAYEVFYGNALTNNELDSSVTWGYAVNTLYLEDEWQVTDRLNVNFGVRYDYYETSDKPNLNPEFLEDYGFGNDVTLDGLDLLMPRFGFTFDLTDSVTLRGGIGLFSGGNPNVWYSNVYSNTNTTAVQTSAEDLDLFAQNYVLCESGVPVCGPGYGVPDFLAEDVAAGNGGNFEIVYLDPNFKAPSEWKYALGVTWVTPNDWVLNADLQIARGKDNALYKHGDLEFTGEYNDFGNGYPIYESVRLPSFVLTNSRVGNETESLALGAYKDFNNGFEMTLGYAYTDSKDVNPMTSSVAASNYFYRSSYDPEAQVLAPSNYNIKHRFTGVFNYTANWFGDYATQITLFAQRSSGVPYSIVLDGYAGTVLAYGYTPYLDFEPNVLVEPNSRNREKGSYWTKADLRISQELPGFLPDHRGSVFIVVDNLTNLINDEWGVMYQANFPYGVTQAQIDNGQAEARIGDASLWEIRVGLNYRF
jgi:hypothetical protein